MRTRLIRLALFAASLVAALPLLGATPRPQVRSFGFDEAAKIRVRSVEPARLDSGILRTRLRAALDGGGQRQTVTTGSANAKRTPLHQRIGRDVELRMRQGRGTPMEIKGTVLYPRMTLSAASTAMRTSDDYATAREFLRANRGLLRLTDPDAELRFERYEVDELSRRHVRFSQLYQDIPVWPADLIVHLDPEGNVDLMNGAFIPTPAKLRTHPVISSDAAAGAARRAMKADERSRTGASELVIYAPADRQPRLAWKIGVTLRWDSDWWVFIDAQNGVTLDTISRVMQANVSGSGVDLVGVRRSLNVWQEGSTYYLIDTTKQMYDPSSRPPTLNQTRGAILVLDIRNQKLAEQTPIYYNQSNDPNSWPLRDGVSAAYWLSQTYDYFIDRHGRTSLDGKGGTMTGIVRVDQNFQNAFWTDALQMMIFGDGDTYAGSLDVVAHEMSHGVTSATANLVYQDQSGALNEAFSDIFGEMAESRTTGTNDWIIGSQLNRKLRSMSNPRQFSAGPFQYPTRMSEFVHTTQDKGGVHINSSIINRAYYLLAEGLSGAIGRRDAERIFYRALTTHLVRNSQFIDARLAAITSAGELFGAGSNQAQKTGAAFDAVEIRDAAKTPDPPEIPEVAAGDSTLFVYYDASRGDRLVGRREAALGDPTAGAILSLTPAAPSRPSVSGDGSLAIFVSEDRDACLIGTNGSGEQCLGLPGEISSVAMSKNKQLFGFVLLGPGGEPDDTITVVDLATETERTFSLEAPAADGESADIVIAADSMDFTADGRYLVYDAFNVLFFADGSTAGVWSIYALDLTSENILSVLPPEPGVDIDFPSISHTSDNFLAFEVDVPATGESFAFALNLNTGENKIVGAAQGVPTVPVYNGDDSGIIYTQQATNPTGSSLIRQAVAEDRITPVGNATLWIADAGYGVIYRRGTYTGPPPQTTVCNAGLETLCLTNNRFKIEVHWKDFQGNSGTGKAVPLTSDTGYFWFFNSANVELVIKVLDARVINQKFWVFYGALSNVEYTITVTDTSTGAIKIYFNPSGQFASAGDTSAFSEGSATSSMLLPMPTNFDYAAFAGGPTRSADAAGLPEANASCTPGGQNLCLNSSRFRVEVNWKDFQGGSGTGKAVPLTSDTGYFWFFNSANVELIIKVLDARVINGKFWVFYGALSNVEYTITVTDTETNQRKTYFNPSGNFASVGDTSAF